MKRSIWDILALAMLAATLMFCLFSAIVFANPHTVLNPFPPPPGPEDLALPTYTPTFPSFFPPTWTPTPNLYETFEVLTQESLSTGTLEFSPTPSETIFSLDTLTPTPFPSRTPGPTRTPTRTKSPAPTEKPVVKTNTPVPPTNTGVPPSATFTQPLPTETNTPVPPTATFTSPPPTDTSAPPPTETSTP